MELFENKQPIATRFRKECYLLDIIEGKDSDNRCYMRIYVSIILYSLVRTVKQWPGVRSTTTREDKVIAIIRPPLLAAAAPCKRLK